MLSSEFPNHEWIPWSFFRVPSNFWEPKSARRQFFDWLSARIGIQKPEDWYRVTRRQVRANGGSGLLMQMYQDSVARAVMDVFPEHAWQFWRFQKVPRGFWENLDHQREFMDFVAQELGIKTPWNSMLWEKWYDVSGKDLQSFGGARLINGLFKMSVGNLVAHAYPEHHWIKWKFSRIGKHSWNDISLQKEYLDWVFTMENMKSLEDWYNMSKKRLIELHGSSLLAVYDRSLYKALCRVYPNHQWDPVKFK